MTRTRLFFLLPLLLCLTACEPKTSSGDKIKNSVDDALDRRPNEKLRDAAEDVRDGVKDGAKEIKDAAKDAKGAGK